ncbi:MAG: hypothetical protein A2Y28_05490 [Chlamydiae bacterium GWC2_50_10]|nr:MAG: hypothetical protein A2Z85_03085 [Chlamydiae bacterium GWA2_50_15]OGN53577.1 MAG: hypothetical protein A2Y28_05490 [Chlamydiae bacterium GWC2_50_10]OGN57295.1 MAG: hypothetical protein A3D18_01275 [Chlamydiae bacterium RIFCSPHIGHO2_02_FULL_49_29]OGN62784.1 MAG: hypothetical protein A3E26_05885 [Chlamydiae bacterium RIFCSPHIGHO2_12_FULL_49_32]OGN70285.1 MAG: hypothetical protein A3I15_02655 [Chlamydiae bacterium RIFCSPLOWO2_02_FULL_49_12]OGN71509.1 MAG: hypothetical protein A3G30_04610 
MSTFLRIAHLSDLHFSKISKSPLQLFSKRWVGNLNLLLFRKREGAAKLLDSLCQLLFHLKVELVLITGDLTSTSHRSEFQLATLFVKQLHALGMEVVSLPGNHDHYTKRAYRQRRFYDFFPGHFMHEGHPFSSVNLKTHAVGVKSLGNHWWLVALDTALATSLISSRGYFSKEIEDHLRDVLIKIPKKDNVLLANHFPFFQNDHPRKKLVRGEALKSLLEEFPCVKLYLHGHTHRRCLADLRANGLPLILDCGSTGMGGRVCWNLIDLEEGLIRIEHFDSKEAQWEGGKVHSFSLEEG